MRRDVSCTVTGTNGGSGTEVLLIFKPASQAKGGGNTCTNLNAAMFTLFVLALFFITISNN